MNIHTKKMNLITALANIIMNGSDSSAPMAVVNLSYKNWYLLLFLLWTEFVKALGVLVFLCWTDFLKQDGAMSHNLVFSNSFSHMRESHIERVWHSQHSCKHRALIWAVITVFHVLHGVFIV